MAPGASGPVVVTGSYQVATLVYDSTFSFCNRFIDPRSRTHDQMVQAARSGNKTIAEGSRAAATSSQTELRLVGVARASLEELLLDYEDYLRQRKIRAWYKTTPKPWPCGQWVASWTRWIKRTGLIQWPTPNCMPPGWIIPIPPWSPTLCSA